MDEQLKMALAQDRLIDITTTGRKSGRPHRIEVAFHRVDGLIYIFGRPTPRPKDWYLNMLKTPEFTFHVKQSAQADLKARAIPVRESAERQTVLTQLRAKFGPEVESLDQFIARSPLVRVEFETG
jgi:deazaflavin-dependent oxidoreductase (nitroreductase family)